MLRHVSSLLVTFALAGCGAAPERDEDVDAREVALTAAQKQLVVDAMNAAPTTKAALLSAGVHSAAATNLIAHRDGADGVRGSADDDPFGDFAEVDAVPQVGPVALEALFAYASSLDDDRPDLNTATKAQLEACKYVGPSLAAALIAYRSERGPFETFEETLALHKLGYGVTVSAKAVASLKACTKIAGERPLKKGLSIGDLLDEPAAYAGSVVVLEDVVLSADLYKTKARTMKVFDFAAWNHADWSATDIPASAKATLVVEPAPEMWRMASYELIPKAALDTKLNRVDLTALFEIVSGQPRLHVRAIGAPGRDVIEVVQRWAPATSVSSLVHLWSAENGIVAAGGTTINRIHVGLLDVHPAILWHEQVTGTDVDFAQYTGCGYDCSVSPWVADGQNLFWQVVKDWKAAGQP